MLLLMLMMCMKQMPKPKIWLQDSILSTSVYDSDSEQNYSFDSITGYDPEEIA
jgi:hypothetical protein